MSSHFGSTGLGADCLTVQVSHSVGSTFSNVITVTAKPVGRTTKHKNPPNKKTAVGFL